jgi:hypothetical protein
VNTRREVADNLADLFRPYNVAVVADPLSAVMPPCIILEPSGPYASHETACWASTLQATLVAGRLDDLGVYDTLDAMTATFCRFVSPSSVGVVNRGATGGPTSRTIGNVDCLAVAFTLGTYDLGDGLTSS